MRLFFKVLGAGVVNCKNAHCSPLLRILNVSLKNFTLVVRHAERTSVYFEHIVVKIVFREPSEQGISASQIPKLRLQCKIEHS